jgi:hypothetical protein
MTGSVAFFAIALFEHGKDRNVSAFIFTMVACALLCLGVIVTTVQIKVERFKKDFINSLDSGFSIDTDRLIYSASNSILLVHCMVANRSPKAAGVTRATLLDRRSLAPTQKRGVPKFRTFHIHYPELKLFTIAGDGSGVKTRHEEHFKEKLDDNLLPLTKTPLGEGYQETGWLMFIDVPLITPSEGKGVFGLTLTDTFGREHGPVDINVELERRDVL